MNKKQFSREFEKQLKKARSMLEPMIDADDFIISGALAKACADALVFCMLRLNAYDLENTTEAVSKMVNTSLEIANKFKI